MRNSIIIYAIILQLITVLFIFFNPSLINIARLGLFHQLFHDDRFGAVFMLTAVCLAIVSLFKDIHPILKAFLLVPQQFFLALEAVSGINYIILGHYADLVIRPWQFIFLDQLPSILTAILYLFVIFEIALVNFQHKLWK